MLELSRLHYPVRSLGYGLRAGIWIQGCTLHCRGCISKDTWPRRPQNAVPVQHILTWLQDLPAEEICGVTISGGEPTEQPGGLMELLHGIQQWRASKDQEIDVLMYTGRSLDDAVTELPAIPDLVDVVISEPFDITRTSHAALKGSDNQVITLFTPLAEYRYAEDQREEAYRWQRTHLDVLVEEQSIWMAGIPLPGDLDRLAEAAARKGLQLHGSTWKEKAHE